MNNRHLLGMITAALAALAAGGAWAATRADEPPVPPVPPDPPAISAEEQAKLDAQLDVARRRLEDAAHEVARLSAQMSWPVMKQFTQGYDEPGRVIIGVQLDPASGKEGARVREVSPGGPAAEAGVRAGDVIVAVNGTNVKGEDPARQVIKIMREVKPDTKVNVRVLRDGKTRDLTLVARAAGPDRIFAEGFPPFPDAPPFHIQAGPGLGGNALFITGALADMELATLSPQLGRYFGTDKGVLVVRAPKDEAFKLQDGDVILAIDGREPTSGSHATRILASYQPGEKIAIKIMRDHKTLTVDTTLPDAPTRPRNMMFFRNGKVLRPNTPADRSDAVAVGGGHDETT